MDYTFLELVQMTARESGTVPSDLPQTVAGQTGRLAKVVYWVEHAWERIQTSRAYWLWMHGMFSGEVSPGLSEYSPQQFGITRFARWVTLPKSTSIYKASLGKSDENFIPAVEYWRYRSGFDIGVHDQGRPTLYAVSPDQTLLFGPSPDDEYIVRGEYYKSPQVLVADGDIPEVPRQHRPIIAWQALLLLSEYDEGAGAIGIAARRYREALGDLERDQLPKPSLYGRIV